MPNAAGAEHDQVGVDDAGAGPVGDGHAGYAAAVDHQPQDLGLGPDVHAVAQQWRHGGKRSPAPTADSVGRPGARAECAGGVVVGTRREPQRAGGVVEGVVERALREAGHDHRSGIAVVRLRSELLVGLDRGQIAHDVVPLPARSPVREAHRLAADRGAGVHRRAPAEDLAPHQVVPPVGLGVVPVAVGVQVLVEVAGGSRRTGVDAGLDHGDVGVVGEAERAEEAGASATDDHDVHQVTPIGSSSPRRPRTRAMLSPMIPSSFDWGIGGSPSAGASSLTVSSLSRSATGS